MIPDAPVILMSGAVGLLVIGIGGMVLSDNLFRSLLALAIAEAGANLMLVIAGYQWGSVAPILGEQLAAGPMVDPVPQAMVLTAIVIGVSVQALALALLIRIYQNYGTLEPRRLKQILDQQLDQQLEQGEHG